MTVHDHRNNALGMNKLVHIVKGIGFLIRMLGQVAPTRKATRFCVLRTLSHPFGPGASAPGSEGEVLYTYDRVDLHRHK